MGTEADKRGNMPIFESLEPRLLLSSTFDLDGDTFIAAGDDAIFSPAWQTRGRYAFSDALLQPGDTPDWDARCDFDGDFHVGSGDYAWLSTNWGKFANDPSIVLPTDPHDSDESMAQADVQGAFTEFMWFSEQYTNMAIAGDDDCFRIDVSNHAQVVTIDCRYEYASGDIDIELLDSAGAQVAVSAYTVDNELIEAALPTGGAYYVRVFSPDGATGQRYDLRWTGAPPTDYHEDDDNEFQAPAHGNFPEDTWYSEVYGAPGVQADYDTFMIDVSVDEMLLTVDCTFSHAEGDINLELWDNGSQMWYWSYSGDDNEQINTLVEFPGTWYVKVVGPDLGQTYDLRWSAEDTPLQAVEDTAVIEEDSPDNKVDVLANDIGDGLVITQVGYGWTDGSFAYINAYPNQHGVFGYSYEIEESGGMRDWGSITVTINPMPDDPIAVNDAEDIPEGSVDYPIDVLDNDSDPDGDALTIDSVVVLGLEPLGTAWTDGNYVYFTVAPGAATGTETLEYTVSDGTGRTDTATVDVTLYTGLTPPVAVDDDATAVESHTVNLIDVMGNDYDPDTQSIHIVDIARQPDHGSADHDGLLVNYAPTEGYRGPDSFEYTIEDTTGRQATATVNMFVLPPSDIHEDDDNLIQADMQGVAPQMVAPCYLLDEDYYMIEIVEGSDDRFTAELWCGADVDMQLLDADGLLVAESFVDPGPGTDRFIDTTAISPGRYYVRVFVPTGPYLAQAYVFQWDSFGPDDPHESDNSFLETDAFGSLPPGTNITGFYNDGDYYRFEVQPGQEYVQIRCTYHGNAPDLDVAVYDDGGSFVGAAEGEHYRAVFADLLPAGTYYALVYAPGGPTGQAYMINWDEGPSDDSHEEDDSIVQAAAQGWLWDGQWFSQTLDRDMAVHLDDDFIEINVKHGFERVQIECTFDHTEGDIDIVLLDANGVQIASSAGYGDTEVIDAAVPAAGDYYIKVFNAGGATGQFYDLIWNEMEYDDAHEWDNTNTAARRLGATPEEVWFDGRSKNVDYYEIYVPQGHLQIGIILEFLHAEGDLQLELLSFLGDELAISQTTNNNEFIGMKVASPGSYSIRIGGGDNVYTGQDYRLWWSATMSDDPHEEDDEWVAADAQGDFPETSPYHGTMWDSDTYRLNVPAGQEHISITCEFDAELGDLDLYMVDDLLNPIAAATGTTDSAFIEMTLASAGTYYVLVYDPAIIYTGLHYTLSWTAAENDDSHESDDTRAQGSGQPLLDENTWFHGRQLDWDFFKITVPFNQQYFEAECLFDPGEGPIQMKLLDEHGAVVTTGRSNPDGMLLRAFFPPQVTKDYYLVVWTVDGATAQYYDLKWSASVDDWHEDDDDLAFGYFKGATEQDVEHGGVIWDQDVWRLDVQPGRETVLIDFEDPSCLLDFELYDPTGRRLETNPSRAYRDRGQIHVAVPEAGSYYLRISQYSGVFGDEFETGETYSFIWRDAPGAEYDWTILWYLAADNNLDAYMGNDLRQAMNVAPVPEVALTWLYDGYDSDGYASLGRTLRKGPGTDEVNVGEWDTSSHENLQVYMEWAVENYPARKYMLIVDDHGATFNGVCTDDTNGTGIISFWELADVIESVRHMDLVLFKTCKSLNLEASYELRHAADNLVGHESLGYANDRWDIAEILDYIYSDPSRTGGDVADEAVSIYHDDNEDIGFWEEHMEDVVVAAVRTANIARLAEAMDTFVQTVIDDATPSDWAWLETSRDQARSWGDMVDIGSFMDWVAEENTEVTASIRNAAANVQVERALICHHYSWLGGARAMGLSVYYPDPTTPRLRYEYDFRHLEFAKDWNWVELFLVDDDSHEQDDARWLANEQDALDANVFFDGISWDDDYFRIYVPEGQEHVQIVCNFSDPEGDINLYLLDERGKQIAAAESTNSNESIHFTVPTRGLYYIRVASDEDPIGQDYALRWQHSVPAGAPVAAAPGDPPPGDKIDVELIVLLDESGIDTSPTLPVGLTEVYEYVPFVVEVWVSNIDGSPDGITGGYMGMMYDDWVVAARSVHSSGIYTDFGDSAMSFGRVDSMGGQAPLGTLGYGDDEWVRLGYVEFLAYAADTCYLSPMPGGDSFARARQGAIDPTDLEFDDFVVLDIVEGPPTVIVDLQADSDTGASQTDNITNDNTPTFEVTVNWHGTISIDYDGDTVSDEIRPVMESGTYEFTPGEPLADGHYPVLVEFDVPGLGTDSDNDPTTVGTVRPEANLAHPFDGESISDITINVHEPYIDVAFFDLNGNGMDAITIVDGAQEFTLSGAAAAGVAVNGMPMSIGGGTYRYFFTGNFVAGAVGVDFTAGSFADIAGNTNDAWGEGFTVAVGQTSVVARHVFYNNSAWDGNDPDANVADDAAIAWEKAALLPGQTASFANYTSYWRGINGIMIDIDGMPPGTPTAEDFGIRVNDMNPDAWSTGPTPAVTVRPGGGHGASDRVTLIWGDSDILNRWVEVTVLAGANMGLAADDVFQFANIVGDCEGNGEVGSSDYGTFGGEFGLRPGVSGLPADFNADGRVDLMDFAILRDSFGNTLPAPAPAVAPEASPAAPVAALQAAGEPIAATAAPVVPVVSQPLDDLLVESPSLAGYISGPQPISAGSSAIKLYRAAMREYDLRPFDDLATDGQDDLLADILAESPLAAPL